MVQETILLSIVHKVDFPSQMHIMGCAARKQSSIRLHLKIKAPFQYKDHLSRQKDSHDNDKLVALINQ